MSHNPVLEALPLSKFNPKEYDAVECGPVIYDAEYDGYERVDEDHPNPTMWSVYLHCIGGGVDCVADFATQAEAEAHASACENWLGESLKYRRYS